MPETRNGNCYHSELEKWRQRMDSRWGECNMDLKGQDRDQTMLR